ncbi:MAG: DUF502 domain-containing protein, partial [Elusimicrobia bacterium]|nr:DUF502 domain-containing protein [Elusimicrobiota bacterium]
PMAQQHPNWKVRWRNYFIAGAAFLFPFGVIYLLVSALFLGVSGFAKPFLEPLFHQFFPWARTEFLIRLVGFAATLGLVTAMGFVVVRVLGKTFVDKLDHLVARLPLLAEVYSAVRKLTSLLASNGDRDSRFRRVVLVEWPKEGVYSMGLVTAEVFQKAKDATGQELAVVFIPTPPNPVNGLLIMVPAHKLTPLDVRVDEAIRIIFSIGLAA